MRDLKSIIFEMEKFGTMNQEDVAQVLSVLKSTMPKEPVQVVEPVIVEETEEQRIRRLTSSIISMNATLDTVKPLYDAIDKATLELKDLIGVNTRSIESGTQIAVIVIDQFEEKNTVFKATGVTRFKAELETEADRIKHAEKVAKAAAKAAKEALKASKE